MAVSLQNIAGTGGSGSTTHTTSSTPITTTTGGYALITFVYDSSAPTAVTDNKGNTYTLILNSVFGGMNFWMYACAAAVGGSGHYATVTTAGNAWPSMTFSMWQGVTSTPLDITGTTNQFNQPWNISSGTLGQADEAVLAFCCFDGTGGDGQTWSSSSGFTLAMGLGQGGSYWPSALFYKVVASTASVTASMSTDNGPAQSAGGGMLIISLKASAGGGTNLTPAQAAIALSGPAPTLARTANVALVPGAASIALSGPAPTLARTANQSLSPGAASIVLAGPAPSLAQTANQNLAPAAASIVLSGPAPTLARTANVALVPGAASIVLTGPAPTLAQSNGLNLVPGAASIALSGPAPTVAQTANVSLVPGAASIALSGPAPALDRTANVALVPGAASIALSGPAPSLAQTSGLVLVPGAASIVLSGPAPSLAQTANVDLSPGPATVALSGPPPSVSQVGPAGDAPTGLRRWAAQMYEAYFAKKAKEKKDAERPVEPEATEEQTVVPPRPKKRRSVRIDTPEETFVAPIAIEDDGKAETRKIIAAVVAQSPQIRADLEEVQRVREQAERDDEEDELLLLSVH